MKQSMVKTKSRRLWHPKKSREEHCVEDLDRRKLGECDGIK